MSPLEMRSTYSAETFNGLMTLSRARLKPSITLRKSPSCLAASLRTASLPSNIACLSVRPSPTIRLMESMQTFRLFLISLKSPTYVSVIFGGMSPLEMRSTYSAETFNGLITESSIPLRLSMMVRSPPSKRSAFARSAGRRHPIEALHDGTVAALEKVGFRPLREAALLKSGGQPEDFLVKQVLLLRLRGMG